MSDQVVFNPRDTQEELKSEEDEEPNLLDPTILSTDAMSEDIRSAEVDYFKKLHGTRVYTFGK